jgi:hypothetical protein
MMLRGLPIVSLIAFTMSGGCARDRETELPDGVQQQAGGPVHQPQQFPPMPAAAPKPSHGPAASASLPPAAPSGSSAKAPPPPPPPPASSPPAALPPAALPPESSFDPTDLYRAQDACLSSCDQFACMKIASAYRQGSGVPKDLLAGRRYAIHACLECGKPGPGIADQCPEYQLSSESQKSK